MHYLKYVILFSFICFRMGGRFVLLIAVINIDEKAGPKNRDLVDLTAPYNAPYLYFGSSYQLGGLDLRSRNISYRIHLKSMQCNGEQKRLSINFIFQTLCLLAINKGIFVHYKRSKYIVIIKKKSRL